jgi:hypothetical protein
MIFRTLLKLTGDQGISLPVEQYSALLQLLPQIEKSLVEKSQDVPRPDYGAPVPKESSEDDDEDEDDEDDNEPAKKNIEATSDEDED